MENFVVSARKYRPVTFDSVVGQSHITTTLKNAIATNHLAQAFLFCGPRGVGKTTCARILAKTINCQNISPEVEACGECESCKSFQNNASINIHELDAASNNSVEDIRNLTDQVRYPPQTGKYKIYIIDEVHMLSSAAFNAFLKTLEEPPAYAIFILATTEKHKILPTILSRCQIFDFNRIIPNDISSHLASIAEKEGVVAESEALNLIAEKADGGLRDALSMFDLNVTFSKDRILRYREVLDNLHILDHDYYFKMTDALLNNSVSEALLILDEIIRKGFDTHLFVIGLLEHFRNLLVSKDQVTISLLKVSEIVKQKYMVQSAATPMSFLLSALSVGGQCDINFKIAKNQRLHVEICLMKIAHISNTLHLSNTSFGAVESEKKKPDSVIIPEEKSNPVVQNVIPPVAVPQVEVVQVSTAPIVVPVKSQESPLPIATRPTGTSKLKSLRNLVSSATNETAQEVAKQIVPDVPVVIETLTLTLDNLRRVWSEFIEMRRSGGRLTSTEEVALDRDMALDGLVVDLPLDNDLQDEKLTEIRPELGSYLRNRLNEPRLQLRTRVAPQDVKRMPYTPLEKMEFMMEKNPNLQFLKSQFGLDIDF